MGRDEPDRRLKQLCNVSEGYSAIKPLVDTRGDIQVQEIWPHMATVQAKKRKQVHPENGQKLQLLHYPASQT